MNTKLFGIFIFGLCFSQALSMKLKKTPKCRGQEIKIGEDDMKQFGDCMKKVAPEVNPETAGEDEMKKALPKEKMACFGKCILEQQGLIDDKGMLSKDTMMDKIKKTWPEEVMEDMESAMGKCVDEHGKNLKADDESCQSYQGIMQCMTVAFVEVCKNKE